MMPRKFWLVVAALALAGELAGADFTRGIEPILIKRCSECHGPDQQKAGLRLDTRAAALQGANRAAPRWSRARRTRASCSAGW